MQRLSIAAMTVALPVSTFAHPGHDHAHWSSAATHGLFVFGVGTVIGVSVWMIARRRDHADQPRRELRED